MLRKQLEQILGTNPTIKELRETIEILEGWVTELKE